MQGGEITSLKFQSQKWSLVSCLRGGFFLSCFNPPTTTLVLCCFQSCFSLTCSLFSFSSAPNSLRRDPRTAHNTQLSFSTNTLMVQHCLLAALEQVVSALVGIPRSSLHSVLGPLPRGHHKPHNRQAWGGGTFGVWSQHWDACFLILGRPLTKARSMATLSFTLRREEAWSSLLFFQTPHPLALLSYHVT